MLIMFFSNISVANTFSEYMATDLVIIDEAVADKQIFYQSLKPGVIVREISSQRDGLQQLTRVLKNHKDIANLHIVSHASDGQILLGDQWISSQTLKDEKQFLNQLSSVLSKDADVLFYGCNLAAGEKGRQFVSFLAEQTGADVAASSNPTGAVALGGDWELELRVGDIQTSNPFLSEGLKQYAHVLQTTFAGLGSADSGGSGYKTLTDVNLVVGNDFVAAGGELYWNDNASASKTLIIKTDNVDAGTVDVSALTIYSFVGSGITLDSSSTVVFRDSGGAPLRTMTLAGNKTLTSSDTDLFAFFDGDSTPPVTGVAQIDFVFAISGCCVNGNNFSNFTFKNITYSNVAAPSSPPEVTSATYNYSTKALVVTGVDFQANGGGADVDVSDLTIRGQANGTRALITSSDVEIDSSTQFTVTLLGGDIAAVEALLNTNGLSALDAVSYNLAAADDFITNVTVGDTSDAAGNGITVSNVPDSNGDLTSAGGVSEPVGLTTTVDSEGEAVNLFDFTLSDGSGDGFALSVSQVVVNVTGTSTDAQRGGITWRLNGPDASDVSGSYSDGADTITFTGLSISVADNTSEIYTVNGFYNDNTAVTEDATFILTVDGDTDLTVGGSGTQMGSTSAVNNGVGGTLDVTATALAITTQPAGSVSGSALTTQPVVTAQDAFGNTDVDFTETVTLTEASAGTLTSTTTTAVTGVATFAGLIYTATADQQSFTLTADDQSGVGSDIPTVDANAVTSDVVATQLVYDSQPVPLTVGSGVATSFTTVPVVSARDGNNVLDTGYSTSIVISEVNGAGAALLSGTGDVDGSPTTVSLTPSSGVATFTGMQITYTASGGSSENFNLRSTSGALSVADSSQLTGLVPDSDGTLTAAGGVTEPIGLSYSIDTEGEATNLFDFTISDGATADGLALGVSQIVLNVTGTTSDADRAKITWRLNGNDASNVTGVYSAVSDTITFSALAISVADGSSETYTVNGYYNDNTGLTHGNTVMLSVDGDTDLTLVSTGTQMASTSAVTNSTGTTTTDDIEPDVTSVAVPANASYGVSDNLDFTVNFNENITVNTGGGTPRLQLTIGASTQYVSYVSGSGGNALLFRYTVQVADLDSDGLSLSGTVQANGGTLQDGAGNNINTVLNSVGSLAAVLVDGQGPTVSEITAVTTPANDATPNVTFNSDEAGTLSVGGSCGSGDEGAVSSGSTTITLTQTDNSTALAAGTYSDCTLTVTDAVGNNSNTLTLSGFTVDLLAPTVAEVTAVVTPSNDSTPDVTLSTNEAGTLAVGGSCGSSSEGAIGSGNTTITLTQSDNSTALAGGTYSDCTFTVTDASGNSNSPVTLSSFTIDVTAPTVAEVTAVTTPANDTTPDVTFSSDEAGTLAVGGSCGSASEGAISSGNTTITLTQADNSSALAEATYSDCTLTITDASGNSNTPVTLSSFVIDVSAPSVAEVTAVVTPGNDGTPDVTISTDEAGTLALGGSCGSASEGAISSGNTTITLTQTDNSTALAGGTYSDCTFTVTDASGNSNSPVTLSSFTVDVAAPTVAEVTAVVTPSNDSTPDVTLSTNEAGTLAVGGSCGSSSEGAISSGNTTITLTQTDNSTALADGTYSDCTLTVTDASGNSNSPVTLSSFTVDVAAPTVAEVTSVATPGNDTTPDVTLSSTEEGTLTVGGSCGSSDEGVITGGNTTITLTQADNSTALADGDYSDCTLTVTDSGGNASNVVTLTLFTLDASSPIVVTNTGLSVSEGDSDSVINSSLLTASDNLSNASNTTYTLVSTSANGSLRSGGSALSNGNTFTQQDIVNNDITYDHDGGETTSDSFAFTLSDALGNMNNNAGSNFIFSVTVTALNDAPSTTADTATTNEDNAVMVDVLANDSDSDDAINAASVTVVSAAANGSTSVNTGTGVITYTPNANFNGSDSFTYTVQDASGDTSAVAVVSITVNPQNDAPVASADSANTDINTLVSIDVAANDSDVDTADAPDTSTLVVIGAASNGSAVVNAGQIDYTPNTDYLGSDSFTYSIDDTNGATSNVATVTVSVIDPNTAPVAANDSAITNEDTATTINVLINDSDPDGSLDATSVAIATNTVNGTTSINAITGEITYTPAANFNGSDSFTYTVEDDLSAVSASATVSITVNSVNDAPVAENDTVILLEDASLAINVLGNDADVDGTLNVATLTVETNGSSGVAVVDGSNVLYTPLDDFVGSDSFTYSVQDSQGLISNTATVTLTVDPVNDAPLANSDAFNIVANASSMLEVTANDSDIDGSLDAAAIVVVNAPTQGTLNNNNDGTLTYTPAAGIDPLAGDSFSYTIDDDSGESSNQATVSIQFSPASAPVIDGTPETNVVEGQAYLFTAQVNSNDDLFALTFTVVNQPAWASFNTATGVLSGTPLQDDVGTTNAIVISVSDGFTSSALAAFDLSVVADVDTDGDTLSDHQEGIDNTDPNDPLDYLDLTPPEVTTPVDIIVDATGLFTSVSVAEILSLPTDSTQAEIESAMAERVTDNVDGNGCCQLSAADILDGQYSLPPGDNIITWVAEDVMGNSASVVQHIYVRPLVSFSKNQVTVEGVEAELYVVLNGESPFYPLEVPYIIDGGSSSADSNDYNLQSGSVIFEEGETSVAIRFTVLDDGISEDDEILELRLDDRTRNSEDLSDGFEADIYDINSGQQNSFQLTIVERNLSPKVTLTIRQSSIATVQILPNGGDVVILATINDPNSGDTQVLDWSHTDNSLVDLDGDADNTTFTLNPSQLSPGRYRAKVRVTDSGGENNTAALHFVVVENLPVLSPDEDTDGDGTSDLAEGTADTDFDGIPDYLDNIALVNVLPERASETNSFLMECDPGIRCRLGEFAIQGQSGGARLSMNELMDLSMAEEDERHTFTGLFDFELSELPTPGQSAAIVIPQLESIPANALYRKLVNGRWVTFVENVQNQLHSAAGSEGFCPPPGDDAWQVGLVEGHWCVQLTIEDGGPNDADGEANSTVVDPGGVATRNTKSYTATGGGGSVGIALIMMLLMIGIGRRLPKKYLGAIAGVFFIGVFPDVTRADFSSKNLFVEASLFQAKSSQSSSGFIQTMAEHNVTVNSLQYDNTAQAYHLKLGYSYNPHVAVMVGYVDMGEANLEIDILDEEESVITSALGEAFPHLGAGPTVNARFTRGFAQRYSVYADLGMLYWNSSVRVTGFSADVEDDGIDPWVTLGAQVAIEQLSIGAGYQYFKLSSKSAAGLGLSLSYSF